jgi:SAM-dependent methyltransferase
MIKPEVVTRRVRDAEWQVAHGNTKGALTLYRRLFKAGYTDVETFGRYRKLYLTFHGHDLPHGEVFDFVYAANIWGGASGGSIGTSGEGSADAATAPYRDFLAGFMREKGIASVHDVGCGDWQLGRLIDWTGIDYVGVDVSSAVMRNTRKYAAKNIRFVEGAAREMELPRADLLILKDVLQHWSNDDILRFLPKLGGFRYSLITNGGNPAKAPDANRNIRAGGYRLIDLSRAPFSVPGSFVFSYDIPVPAKAGGLRPERKRVFLAEGAAR